MIGMSSAVNRSGRISSELITQFGNKIISIEHWSEIHRVSGTVPTQHVLIAGESP